MSTQAGYHESPFVSRKQAVEASELDMSNHAHDRQLAELRSVGTSLIDQAIELLRTVVTTDAQLSTVSSLVPGSTVGKHLRHLHDHFRILLESALSDEKILNYDSRQRNMPMESSQEIALEEFLKLKALLSGDSQMEAIRPELKLKLLAVTPYPISFETNFSRELWFASLHATHHYALIRVIVTGELGLELPKEFGVAPSTLANAEKAKM